MDINQVAQHPVQSLPAPQQTQPVQPARVSIPTNSQSTSQATTLDPQVVNLAKAIRQVESGGNYQAKGGSGEHGAYQWMPSTWASDSQKYLGQNIPLEQSTPEQQNEVAYKKIADWKAAGFNVGQIASMWNAGGGHPDAYLQNHVGTNSQGVSYNTPAYAEKVAKAYQQFKANTPGFNPTPYSNPTIDSGVPNPNTQQSISTQQKTDNPINIGGIDFRPLLQPTINAGKSIVAPIGDVINDIKGQSDKTALQQLGDVGLSALWFLPFGDIAEGIAGGAEAIGASAKAASAIGSIGTGIGTGYASDVAGNLAQGKTGTEALKPGVGTVTGGALGATSAGAGQIYSSLRGEEQAINKAAQAYEDAAGATKSGIKGMSKTASRGLNPNSEFLANAGIPPETQEINGRRVFTTGADSQSQKTIQQRISDLTDLRDKAIEKTSATVSLNQMRQDALKQVQNEFFGTARTSAENHINQEFDAYAQQHGGNDNISLTDANNIKKDLQSKTNYDATRPSQITQANGVMAKIAKNQVENTANQAGSPAIKELNKVIQQHIDSLDFLNKINGQTVKGGRIGNYIARGIGTAAGGLIGHTFGGGLTGDILGGAIGEEAGGFVSRQLQKMAAGGSTTAAILGRMAKQDPQIVEQFLEYIGSKSKNIAPNVKPTQLGAGGIVGNLLKKTPGSQILQTIK
jgi:hypothetical protein